MTMSVKQYWISDQVLVMCILWLLFIKSATGSTKTCPSWLCSDHYYSLGNASNFPFQEQNNSLTEFLSPLRVSFPKDCVRWVRSNWCHWDSTFSTSKLRDDKVVFWESGGARNVAAKAVCVQWAFFRIADSHHQSSDSLCILSATCWILYVIVWPFPCNFQSTFFILTDFK